MYLTSSSTSSRTYTPMAIASSEHSAKLLAGSGRKLTALLSSRLSKSNSCQIVKKANVLSIRNLAGNGMRIIIVRKDLQWLSSFRNTRRVLTFSHFQNITFASQKVLITTFGIAAEEKFTGIGRSLKTIKIGSR